MKRAALTGLVFVVATIASGCESPVSTNANDYVGEYVLRPDHGNYGNFASFIVLRRNGTSVAIRVSSDTGSITTSEMKWNLYGRSGDGEAIRIGDRGYPIRYAGTVVKLAIDFDRDVYYEKVR